MSEATQIFLKAKPKLGEILMKYTSLSEVQLNEALRMQEKEGGFLGEILIRKNLLLPHEVMRALCMQIGLQFIEDLKPNDIDPLLVTDIPINYAKTKEIIPIGKETTPKGDILVVATADPFSATLADDLQVLTGRPVRLVISTSNQKAPANDGQSSVLQRMEPAIPCAIRIGLAMIRFSSKVSGKTASPASSTNGKKA